MATAITLSPTTTGLGGASQQQPSADRANALLSRNHDDFHLFFNERGFHNHIAHHLLTIYALGATPEQLKVAFDVNASMQKPQLALDEEQIAKLEDAAYMLTTFGKEENYHDLCAFFERRMARDGLEATVNEYLFSGSEVAEDLMVRMYAGIWHPLILFGFGIEFELPAIVAEALAQAACHLPVYARFLHESEQRAQRATTPSAPLVQLVREVQADPALHDAEHWHGGATFNEHIIGNAPARLIELAAQWRIDDSSSAAQLAYKTAESANVNAWIGGAAQRRGKAAKFDFIFMHQINMSLFFSAFNRQRWISDAHKARLLEWQTRIDLLQYAAELAPPLLTDEITGYVPQGGADVATWEGVVQRTLEIRSDDGHVAKLVRALAHARDISAPYEAADAGKAAPELPVKGDMWLQLANMAYDSTWDCATTIQRFVRGAGNDDAWKVVPDRAAK